MREVAVSGGAASSIDTPLEVLVTSREAPIDGSSSRRPRELTSASVESANGDQTIGVRLGRGTSADQDKAYFRIRVDQPVVGGWIALDATCANGCMHVLPGSHREGPVMHVHGRDWQICDSWVQTGRDTAVPLPAGSALFFDGFLHHGTPANRTDSRRRAVQFHYARADVVETESAEHERIYGAGTSTADC